MTINAMCEFDTLAYTKILANQIHLAGNILVAFHRLQIHGTNPLERLNAELKRRTKVVVGAMMIEQNAAWSLQRRTMPLEGLQ